MATKRVTQIRITGCSSSLMWYSDQIGKVFTTINETDEDYLVKAKDGYSNIILKQDCEEVTNDAE